jgi:hypothetical protein
MFSFHVPFGVAALEARPSACSHVLRDQTGGGLFLLGHVLTGHLTLCCSLSCSAYSAVVAAVLLHRPDRWCAARSVVAGRLINGYR